LVAVLKTNSKLRQRYAKHFGVGEAEVVDYVKRALVPYRLPESRNVLTYGVTRTGRIYAVRTRLKKGTRVWANRSGVPILKWLCANPLAQRLPGTRIASPIQHTPRPIAQAKGVEGLAPGLENGMVPPTIVSENFTPPIFASESGLEGIGTGSVVPIVPPGIGTGAHFGFSGLAAAAFVPVLIRGGSAPPSNIEIIPEPGTVALLLSGGGIPLGLISLRRLRRQRVQKSPKDV
jgi:hypothetical protein